ncbi:hypothetical protein ACE1SV_23600 [Streptomyces sennicomposti]
MAVAVTVLGEEGWSSDANAAGADRSARGAMTAVAAVAAMARRSFMKTSESLAYGALGAARALREASAVGPRVWLSVQVM